MRRAFGTGSISEVAEGRWEARIYLRGGKRKMRRRRSREDAEAAIQEMFDQYAGELGYFTGWPRPYKYGSRSHKRKGMSLRVRFAVFDRDGFRCVYCGATKDDGRLVVDHVRPVADGGGDEMDNLVTACLPCNAGKAGRPLLSPIPSQSVAGRRNPSQ